MGYPSIAGGMVYSVQPPFVSTIADSSNLEASIRTEDEPAVAVLDALGEVDVAVLEVSLAISQLGAKDGNLSTTLNGEVDVLGGLREVC